MAILNCRYQSACLGKACEMNVIIPQAPRSPKCPPYPVLYLLHGISDDSTMWLRRTSIERYADAYDLVIVMPDGQRSFYVDAVDGYKFWTMVAEELPEIVSNILPVSTRREDTFAAGLSMGGYGALKLALRQPDKFGGAVGISSVADIMNWFGIYAQQRDPMEARRIFGSAEELKGSCNDLMALAESAAKAAFPPRIMTICGTEDFLYNDNQTFRRHMEDIAYPGYEYREGPGIHSWEFWDKWIPEALRFLMAGRQ